MNLRQIACIIVSVTLLTFCSKVKADAVYLQKSQPAPFSGYLLDDKLELKARTAIKQNDTFKELVDNQYDMINNLHQQNRVLEEKVVILSNNQENDLVKVLYFIGGVLVGGYAVNQIKK